MLSILNEVIIPLIYTHMHQAAELHQGKASSHKSKFIITRKKCNKKLISMVFLLLIFLLNYPWTFIRVDYSKEYYKPETVDELLKKRGRGEGKNCLVNFNKQLSSWKLNCRIIVKEKDNQIEYLKQRKFI